MEIRFAIAKVDRFASPEQGDQVEMIERPNGGVSIILAEGKLDSNRSRFVARKAVHRLLSLIFEGIHDGAASRAVLSGLKAEYHGLAELSLNLLSCDLESDTIILTKNNTIPIIITRNGHGEVLSCENYQGEMNPLTPSIYQFQIESDLTIIMFSDGVASAGDESNHKVDWCTLLESLSEEQRPSVQELADFVLNQAIGKDYGEPHDDMTVVAIQVSPANSQGVRRISVVLPM